MVLDRPETQTDVTLSDEEKETSEERIRELEAQVAQARSDALSDIGRLQTEAANSLRAATAAQERVKKMLKEQEDAELQAAGGNQEQVSAVTERQKRRRVETDLDEATLKLNQKDEELGQIKKDSAEATKAQTARDIATRRKVDADRLIRLSKLTDGSVESIEELAKELPKKEVRPPTKTDDGDDTGKGGGSFTLVQIENMSDDEYVKNKDAIDKAQMAGKIK